MRKALVSLFFIGLALVFASNTSYMASNATTCAAEGCPNTGRCVLPEDLAVLATRKQQGSRKALSFNYDSGCKVCAEHTLDIIGQVYQGGLNSALPKAANLLSDVSAFFDHVEIGLTHEEVRAAREVDTLVDDSQSEWAARKAKTARRAAATLVTEQATFHRAETMEALSEHIAQRCAASSPVRQPASVFFTEPSLC